MRFAIWLEGVSRYDFARAALERFARHFDDFEKFSRFYSLDINHGYYWHLSDDPDFRPSVEKGPRDMSSMASGGVKEPGALMVTSHLDHWDSFYNGEGSTRGYAALLDLSEINPEHIKQVSRGFGNEIYLPPEIARKARVVEVMPAQRAKAVDKQLERASPQSKQELHQIWLRAKEPSSRRTIGGEDFEDVQPMA
jgi:hypothetical protein